MINRNERILVEALRHSDRVSIRFDDITVYVRNGEFSHDVAIPCKRTSTGSTSENTRSLSYWPRVFGSKGLGTYLQNIENNSKISIK